VLFVNLNKYKHQRFKNNPRYIGKHHTMVVSLFYANKILLPKLLQVGQSQFDNHYNASYTFIPISLKSNIINDLMMFLGSSTSPLGYRFLVQPLSFRNSLLLDRENPR